jgi:hypothetical protein
LDQPLSSYEFMRRAGRGGSLDLRTSAQDPMARRLGGRARFQASNPSVGGPSGVDPWDAIALTRLWRAEAKTVGANDGLAFEPIRSVAVYLVYLTGVAQS